jgi:DNA-binding transcriptional LysR family regulator
MRPDLPELLPNAVVFVAVAQAKSFSRAGKTLRMPVSTVSRRVADLEGKLGVQLLHRTTRQVVLTPAGARYLEHAQLIVDAAEAAHAELAGEVERPRGTLRISTTPDFALTYLWPVLRDFAARHPDVSFELDLSARAVDLLAEGFDLAIRLGPLPDSQLQARKLGVSPQSLYAAPAYLKRAGAPLTPAALSAHECLRIQGAAHRVSRWTLTRDRDVETVEVKGRFVVSGMNLLVELATAGLGIATIDDGIAQRAVAAGALVHVLPDWSPAPAPIHALTPSKLLPSRTRLLLDCLRDHLTFDVSARVLR